MPEKPEAPGPTDQEKWTHHHLAVIGLVVARWSAFEAIIDLLTIRMAGVPIRPGLCLTSQVIGPARKMDAYISLVRLRGGNKFLGELETLSKAAVMLAERRNRTIHDSWGVEGGRPGRLEMTARRKLRFEWVDVPTDDLKKLCAEIDDLHKRFSDLDRRIRASHSDRPANAQPASARLETLLRAAKPQAAVTGKRRS